MKTNQHVTPVASFKPHQDPKIVTYDTTTWSDMDYAANTAWRRYRCSVEVSRNRINNTLRHLYGDKIPHFQDSYISEMVCGINEIMKVSGKDIKDVARDFRNYLGYPCKFFRRENGREVPIDSKRIVLAYKAIKERQIIKKIEKILYY